MDIKFGTDGWRGIIADDFTFDNVRRVAGAIAAYVLKHEDPSHGVVVGYDTRFASPRAARVAAEVLAAAGIPVKLANDYTPTPAISLAVKNGGTAGGVVITSSHNPWNWNGVKFKGKFGGSATPAIMKVIEDEVRAGTMPHGQAARIEEVDLKPPYVERICQFADLDLITKANFRFAVDSMHGSGRGVLAGIFRERGIAHVAIRQELNPLFPGINPEPIEPHVALLQQTVVQQGCHAGLATDGDADRIGAVAEDGSFVDAHKIFSVLLRWLLERKQWPGDVVRAFNTTNRRRSDSQRNAEVYDFEPIELLTLINGIEYVIGFKISVNHPVLSENPKALQQLIDYDLQGGQRDLALSNERRFILLLPVLLNQVRQIIIRVIPVYQK